MKEKQIINFIIHRLKNDKIKIDVEEKKILYYKSDNDWLGRFYLKSNEFDSSYWFYHDIKKYFKNKDEMYEFSKPFIEKIIGRLLNKLT